jgi:hypothetical protein
MVNHRWGWDGYTYKWNDSQTDAELLDSSDSQTHQVRTEDGPKPQTWNFPSRSDCRACHTRVEKFILGASTRQLNRRAADGENQLAKWNRLGVFTNPLPNPPERLPAFPDWRKAAASPEGEIGAQAVRSVGPPNNVFHADATHRPIATGSHEELAARARAYLDVHCAVCHTPRGTGYTRIDLRHDVPLEKMFLVDQPAERPRPGAPPSKLVTAGDPAHSELLTWIHGVGDRQMPPLGRSMVDPEASALLTEWIRGMPTKQDGGR